jgi:hypothetical protein
MTFPRRAGLPALALLTFVAALAPALAAAQSAPSKSQSPNGKIVFQSTQGGDGFVNDIYVMDADGEHQTRLTDNASDGSRKATNYTKTRRDDESASSWQKLP